MKKYGKAGIRILALLLSLCLLSSAAVWGIPPEEGANGTRAGGFSTNLTGWHGVTGQWDQGNDGFRGNNQDTDGYAVSDVTYTPGESFSYEVSFTLNGGSAAGIIFGVRDASNPVGFFYSLNVDKGRNDSRIFWNGGGEGFWDAGRSLTAAEKSMDTMTLRIDYDGTDTLKAYLNGIFVTSKSGISLPAGLFGLNTFHSDVTYHSATLRAEPAAESFVHNLAGYDTTGGRWNAAADGMRGTMDGDSYLVARENLTDSFTFEGDMTLVAGTAIGVLFGVQGNDPGASGGYCINFDLGGGALGQQFRIFEYPWKGSLVSDLAKNRFAEAGITPQRGESYHFKLQYAGGKISYTFDGVEIFRDIVDLDTTQVYPTGRVGVMGCNAVVRFQNLTLTNGSWDNEMSAFTLEPSIAGLRDGDAFYFLVEDGADLTKLAPVFELSAGASSDKASGSQQDFTQPVEYRVSAQSGAQRIYTATVYTPSMAGAGDRAAASEMEARIDALPPAVTPMNQAQVKALYEDYLALTPLQRLLVSNAAELQEKAGQGDAIAAPIRVLCVGDSITEGYGSSDFNRYAYPAQLQQILGEDYTVYNAGVGGANAIEGGQLDYRKTDRYALGKAFGPEVVILMLGTNDGIDWVWQGEGANFKADYAALVKEYLDLPTHPKVFLALPMTSYGAEPQKTYIREQIVPAIREIGGELGLDVIDMHSFSSGHQDWFPDGIHPNDGAYTLIAREFAGYIRALGEADIASITLDGQPLENFAADTFSYDVVIPRGGAIPRVEAAASSKDAKVRVSASSQTLPAEVTVSVTSGDGRGYQEYVLHLSEEPQSLEEARQAGLEALAGYKAANDSTAEAVMALITKGIMRPEMTAAWSEPFTLVKATAGKAGSIQGKITLTLGEETADIPVHLVIPALGGDLKPEKPGKPSVSGGSGSDWKWPESTAKAAASGKENPKSGDASAIPAACAVLLLSAGAAVFAHSKKK